MFLDFQAVFATFAGVLLFLFLNRLKRLWQVNPNGVPYPPGPRPKPIIGNTLPTVKPWLAYTDWGKQYGSDILHAQVFGQHFIILNSLEDATELLERRSGLYSDRPYVPMIDLSGWGFDAAVIPYGSRWRLHRKYYQEGFRKDKTSAYQPLQTRKVRNMLRDLLKSPNNFIAHHRTLAGAAILAAVYDYNVSPTDDRFIYLAERTVQVFSQALMPGAYLVNGFPFFRFVPSWFPGAQFQSMALKCRRMLHEMKNVPFDVVRQQMASGTVTPSVLSRLLEEHDNRCGSEEQEEAIKEVAATAYAAGADTTASALSSFVHAMATHPLVQQKAQDELDRVVGTDRLPDHEDRASLPYIEALYREVLRWRPVTPLSVPHSSTMDDMYKGYFIPKGSVMITNIWAMTRDERVYENPEAFWPERFFDADGELNKDEMSAAFGFGRRLCPGRYLAGSALWLGIASTLSAFNINKVRDLDGKEIEIEVSYSDGLLSHPLSFPCSIVPRSDQARKLVEESD